MLGIWRPCLFPFWSVFRRSDHIRKAAMQGIVLVYKRVIRVSATFLGLSLSGCLIAHFAFRVSLDELSVAVAVPIVWVFAISRLLRLVLPETTPTEQQPHGRAWVAIFVCLTVVFLAVIATIDSLLSAGTFSYLGLEVLASRTLRLAEFLGIISVGAFTVAAFLMARKVMGQTTNALITGVWRILRFPARFADALHYLPKIDQHQH